MRVPVESVYNEQGALHRPGRKHAEESQRHPAAANRHRSRGRQQFNQPGKQVILSPPAFVSGKFLYPYADLER
jgi:hypothetical protein